MENITVEEIASVLGISRSYLLRLFKKETGRTVQEYKKIVQSKQSAINDNLKAIPGRIAEACLAIPEAVANVDESERVEIEKKIADLNDEILAIKNCFYTVIGSAYFSENISGTIHRFIVYE